MQGMRLTEKKLEIRLILQTGSYCYLPEFSSTVGAPGNLWEEVFEPESFIASRPVRSLTFGLFGHCPSKCISGSSWCGYNDHHIHISVQAFLNIGGSVRLAGLNLKSNTSAVAGSHEVYRLAATDRDFLGDFIALGLKMISNSSDPVSMLWTAVSIRCLLCLMLFSLSLSMIKLSFFPCQNW